MHNIHNIHNILHYIMYCTLHYFTYIVCLLACMHADRQTYIDTQMHRYVEDT